MKKSFISLSVCATALLLLGAGCTANKPSDSTATPTTPPVQQPPTKEAPTPAATKPALPPVTPPPTTKPVAKTVTVLIQGNAFAPQVVAINEGDSVEWINKDAVSHTTVSDGALLWDSGNLKTGMKYKRMFKAGTYTYHCGIHPSMTGTIIVH